MDEVITNQNSEQQPNTQPAENGNQGGGRLFTQQEVDRILKERLARERAKATPQEPTEAEKREKDLTARESRLNCRAYLLDNGLPAELLDVLDTSDVAKFQRAADTVHSLMKSYKKPHAAPLYDPTIPVDPKTGFEPGRKHKPKGYPYRSK